MTSVDPAKETEQTGLIQQELRPAVAARESEGHSYFHTVESILFWLTWWL